MGSVIPWLISKRINDTPKGQKRGEEGRVVFVLRER